MLQRLLWLFVLSVSLTACNGEAERQEDAEPRFKITIVNGEIAGFELADRPDIFGPDATWDDVFLYSPRAIVDLKPDRIPEQGGDYTIQVYYVSEFRDENLMAVADDLDQIIAESAAIDE